ncbi:MAG: diacylglycerol kinase [Porticoccaceae bacterium]|jgi:diacylglycerol kinase (ATP)|nr:diacylglycerol kinase [Porticoccaceae bacterium]MBT3797795.1 diacylglycerol kinase [Porticoccaceae bacterium]MBT4164124.1 diacylglycerol kinase [Porticoccaceae bacterium]MBT4210958.1 diacylglycerol kinase [Porticoccaceae bacterium]MBT4592041.1 diacylglycerol kinase [Porticoccaceae bacterium]
MFDKGILGLLYRRLVLTTKHSIQGLESALKTQEAFRCEMLASLILIPLAFYLANGYLQLILLIGAVLMVLIVELLNTGIEVVVDRIGLEFHELSGRAKDVGSAAVLISLILFLSVWGLILNENYCS